MSGEKICPVVAAIREIRGAGMDDVEQIAVIGGAEYACDEVLFAHNLRKIRLARIELSRPDLLKMRQYTAEFAARPTADVYAEASAALPSGRIQQALAALRAAIGDFFAAIESRMRVSRNINLTIPSLPDIPRNVADPVVLEHAVNALVDFIGAVNINAILREPVPDRIQKMPAFSVVKPETVVAPSPTGTSPDELLTMMKVVLAEEEKIYKYVAAVEAYHCGAINKIHEIAALLGRFCGLIATPVAGVN